MIISIPEELETYLKIFQKVKDWFKIVLFESVFVLFLKDI